MFLLVYVHAKPQPSPHSTRRSLSVSVHFWWEASGWCWTVCHFSLSHSPSSIGDLSTNCREAMFDFGHIITFLTENVTSLLLDFFDTVHGISVGKEVPSARCVFYARIRISHTVIIMLHLWMSCSLIGRKWNPRSCAFLPIVLWMSCKTM